MLDRESRLDLLRRYKRPLCVHFGPRIEPPPSCREPAVYACGLHGTCTKVPSDRHRCCLRCLDYRAPIVEPAPESL